MVSAAAKDFHILSLLLLLHFLKSVILHAAIKLYIQYLASSA